MGAAQATRASAPTQPTVRSTARRPARVRPSARGARVATVTGPRTQWMRRCSTRRGRERKGRPVGRYFMAVRCARAAQIAVLEGRNLIEHYVSRPADDVAQIHGNIYLGRVQNVLPGMEAAFVDIGTPKNAVLYRGDVQYDAEDVERAGEQRPHRGDPQAQADDHLPGHQEPDRPTRAPASPRRCRCPGGSWCSSRTPRPTASPSAWPTTSASACAASSTR